MADTRSRNGASLVPGRSAVLLAPLLLLAAPSGARDSYIAAMAGEVERPRVEDVISTLEAYGTRYSFTSQCDAAGDWLHTTLQGYGLDVSYEPFVYAGKTMNNIVARLPGQVNPGKVYIVGAHYDSTSSDAFNSAPGADDNASGVAAVLEAARILSAYNFENTIEFIGFSGEEQGMRGSEANVANALSQGKTIAGVVNLDMIGYWPAGSDRELDIGKNGPSTALAAVMEKATIDYAAIAVRNWPDTGVCYDDQASYWNAGFEAIILMDCYEAHLNTGGESTPHYHKTTDTSATLDLDLTTEAVRATVAAMATLAVPVITPMTLYAVKDLPGNGVQLSWQGGAVNFDVDASLSKDFSTGVTRLTPASGIVQSTFTHPAILGDGIPYFYRVDRH